MLDGTQFTLEWWMEMEPEWMLPKYTFRTISLSTIWHLAMEILIWKNLDSMMAKRRMNSQVVDLKDKSKKMGILENNSI